MRRLRSVYRRASATLAECRCYAPPTVGRGGGADDARAGARRPANRDGTSGELVGERALVAEEVRAATIVAAERVFSLTLSRTDFTATVRADGDDSALAPELSRALLRKTPALRTTTERWYLANYLRTELRFFSCCGGALLEDLAGGVTERCVWRAASSPRRRARRREPRCTC